MHSLQFSVFFVLQLFGIINAAVFTHTDYDMTINLNIGSVDTTLVINSSLTDVWFGVGFGVLTMSDNANTITISGADHTLSEWLMTSQNGPEKGSNNITLEWSLDSIVYDDNAAVIMLSRANDVGGGDYYTFNPSDTQMDMIWAHGTGTVSIGYHGGGNYATNTLDGITTTSTTTTTTTSTTTSTSTSTSTSSTSTTSTTIHDQATGVNTSDNSTQTNVSTTDVSTTALASTTNVSSTLPLLSSTTDTAQISSTQTTFTSTYSSTSGSTSSSTSSGVTIDIPFERFEPLIDELFLNKEKSVTLAMGVDISNNVIIIEIQGPSDKWFGVGWDAVDMKMTDTYATIIQGSDIELSQWILEDNRAGMLVDYAFDQIAFIELNDKRTVIMIQNISSQNGVDFQDFVYCEVSDMNLISAVGTMRTFDYHLTRNPDITITQIEGYCPSYNTTSSVDYEDTATHHVTHVTFFIILVILVHSTLPFF